MTDLVERLRHCYDENSNDHLWDITQEAAKEIERLDKQIESLQNRWASRDLRIEQLQKEREALYRYIERNLPETLLDNEPDYIEREILLQRKGSRKALNPDD